MASRPADAAGQRTSIASASPWAGVLQTMRGSAAMQAVLRDLGQVWGYLGPGQPVPSSLLPAPDEYPPGPADALPMPRTRVYTSGQNIVSTPRAEEGRTSFEILRGLATNYDVIGICVQTIINEVTALDWQIVPVETADKTAPDRLAAPMRELTQFFRRPDPGEPGQPGTGHWFRPWVAKFLREDLEVGAPAFYKRPRRDGKLYGLEIVSGETLQPIIDNRGKPREIRQTWRGIPSTIWPLSKFCYAPRMVRAGSAYGIAPTEVVWMAVNAALRRQALDLTRYTDGNIPAGLLQAKPEWSDAQILQMQDYLNDLWGGNNAARVRLQLWPVKPEVHEFAPHEETPEFLEWLARVTMAIFGVKIETVGLAKQTNRATAQTSEQTQLRAGVGPYLNWLEDVFTSVIWDDFGQEELRFAFAAKATPEQAAAQADTDDKNIKNQIYSAYYVRDRDGIRLSPDDPLQQQQAGGPAPPTPGLPPGAPPPEPEPPPEAAPTPDEEAAPAEGSGPPANALLLYARSTLRKVAALNAALAKAGGPGSHGGHYWIDAKGKVRYGAQPKGYGERAKRGQERKARAATRHQAAVQRHQAAQARKAERHRQVLARQNGRDELRGAEDLVEMRGKGWAVLSEDGHGEGPDGRAAANEAAQAAAAKDPKNLYAVVKVNGTYYVVSKAVDKLQQERTGSKARNVVSGGSHKTRAETVRREARQVSGGAHPVAKAAAPDASEDWEKWQRKALARARAGRPPLCGFVSPAIPDAENLAAFGALSKAASADEVRAVFAPYLEKAARPARDRIHAQLRAGVRAWLDDTYKAAAEEHPT